MINGAAMNIELYGIESQILKLLSESEGNILDNTALIETLAEAKVGVIRSAVSSIRFQLLIEAFLYGDPIGCHGYPLTTWPVLSTCSAHEGKIERDQREDV